jgi:hypothetical protein
MPFEATPVDWNDYYETPTTSLFWFDESANTYNLDQEPSPMADYFYYD